ncbi:metal-dependent hydrolase [Cohnella mopanensis]|uniref:metal-dependent hydrolase n=1 Tax=Cohnella mopanensis TaxID=2911966 RepID=UPI001EF79B7F|nr:metal-dependent hydrolase [Cohnella mopanensis]
MDYMTHTLFGIAVYGSLSKINMDSKTKWSLFATSVGANVIPDIDIQWAREGADYLMSHRGITHSFLMVPVWAALFSFLSYVVFRVKDRRIYWVAVAGVLLHIISDWTNAWGTGLLEPFTSRRYAIGIIPNKGYIFWAFAAVLLPFFLLFRSKEQWQRIFRTFWVIGAVYVGFQIAHSAYVYLDLKQEGYAQVALRADRWPGGISYYAKKDDVVVEGRHEVGGESGIIQTFRNDPVDMEQLMQYRPAKNLLLFAPFVVTQNLGESIRIFDPRFGGRVPILNVEVPASAGRPAE